MSISLNITQEDLNEITLTLKERRAEAAKSETRHSLRFIFDISRDGEMIGVATFLLPLQGGDDVNVHVFVELDDYQGEGVGDVVQECTVFAVEKLGIKGEVDVRIS